MIYVKSPLRITLGGGGSDLPWFYKKHGGYVLQLQLINLYIYLVLDVHMIIKYG